MLLADKSVFIGLSESAPGSIQLNTGDGSHSFDDSTDCQVIEMFGRCQINVNIPAAPLSFSCHV